MVVNWRSASFICDYCDKQFDTVDFILDPEKDRWFDICDSCWEQHKDAITEKKLNILKQNDDRRTREQTRRKKKTRKDPSKIHGQGR